MDKVILFLPELYFVLLAGVFFCLSLRSRNNPAMLH